VFKIAARSAAALARLSVVEFEAAAASEPAGPDGETVIARFVAGVLDRRLRSVEFLDSMLAAKA
jgi:hypothetical protein